MEYQVYNKQNRLWVLMDDTGKTPTIKGNSPEPFPDVPKRNSKSSESFEKPEPIPEENPEKLPEVKEYEEEQKEDQETAPEVDTESSKKSNSSISWFF